MKAQVVFSAGLVGTVAFDLVAESNRYGTVLNSVQFSVILRKKCEEKPVATRPIRSHRE